MGAWGKRLYDNDYACDVKESYIKFLREEQNYEKATDRLFNYYEESTDDQEDGQIFYLVLADVQWDYGFLKRKYKEKALRIISQIDKELINTSTLKEKLNRQIPKLKMPKKIIKKDMIWQIGDIYAYKMISEDAKKINLYNKYVLIVVLSKYEHDKGFWPIVWLKVVDNLDNMNIKKINLGEFIQGWFVDYDERFLPYSKDIKEKYKDIVYETDEWGFLPEYKIIFMLSNRNQKNEKYIFLDNYKLDDITKPKI